jgi:4-amino-4-deoxy-L-arabinose transferase-like glycosyltransferase
VESSSTPSPRRQSVWKHVPTVANNDRRSAIPLLLLGTILLVAAAMRLYALGREGLWCDEAYTALTVRLPLGAMISKLLRTDEAPPFFYILEKLSTHLAGESEAALRAVPAFAGILVVAVLLWRAHRHGARADAWSAVFVAVAAFGVFHARQARSYGLLILLATGLVLSAKDLLLGRSRAGPWLTICGTLLWLTHHVGIVLVLSSLLLWPLGTSTRPRLRSWILWHTPPLALWAAYWIAARSQLEVHAVLNPWTAHYWKTHPLGLAPFYSLGVLIPGDLPPSQLSTGFATLGHLSPVWSVLSLALGMICVLAAVLRARGPSSARPAGEGSLQEGPPNQGPPPEGREIALEAAFVLLPLLALLAASFVVNPVYVLTRTDVLAFPAFALLIGHGLARLSHRAAAGIVLFWLAMSLVALAPTYGFGNPALAKGNDRRLAREMATDGLARDDWIVHTYMTAPSIEYYLERLGAVHRAAWFPPLAESNTASAWPAPPDSLPAYLDQAKELRRTIAASLPQDGAVWILSPIETGTAEAIQRGRTPETLTVEQLAYPVTALIYTLMGTRPMKPVCIYTQDWVSGLYALLRIPRASWAPPEALPPIDFGTQGAVQP